jgi:filamentous hemagglutinin
MAVTRIKNNQITDATVVASAKLVDYSITAGKIANNLTYGSDLTIAGNLTVNGNTTTIDTTVVTVEDPMISLAYNQSGSPTLDIGWIGVRGTANNVAFIWDESALEFAAAFTTDDIGNTTISLIGYANLHVLNANVAGNISIGGNVDITGNITSINVTGNITGGNLNTPGLASVVGNVIGGNISTAGLITAVGNINSGANIVATANVIGGNISTAGLITAAGNILTSGIVTATGNVTGGNLLTGGLISATGNINSDANIVATANVIGGNVSTAGLVTATGNVTGGNLLTGGLISATGNINGGNLYSAGTVTAVGNITAPYFIGNIIGNVDAAGANTQVQFNDSDILAGSAGFTFDKTANLVTVTGNIQGGNLRTAGLASVTGNINSDANIVATANVIGGNISTAGLVTATGNVTGGNLITTGVATVTGNINSDANIVATANVIGGNISTAGLITATGNVTGGNLITTGVATVTGNINSGANVIVAANVIGGNISTAGLVTATGNITGGNLRSAVITSPSSDITITSDSANANVVITPKGTGNVVLNNAYINNLRDPILAQDAASKQYVDDAVSSGITIHTPVRVESPTALNGTYAQGGTTATVTSTVAGNTVVFGSAISPQVNDQYWFTSSFSGILANTPYFVVSAPNTSAAVLSITYSGAPVTDITSATGLTQPVRINSGVGATLTNAGANATLVIDGVTLSNTNRVLIYQQANAVHNGVYVVSEAGNATTAWQLTRSDDMNTYAPDDLNGLDAGDYFYVQEGDTGAGESYVMTAPVGPTIIGYANLTFTQFSASQVYSANTSAGLSLIGTVFSAKVDNNTTAFDGGGNIIVKAGANLTTPNIGAATGTSLSVTGNITGSNVVATNGFFGNVNLTGDIVVNSLTANTFVSATGNVIGGNISTAGLVTATGNVTGSNLITGGLVTATGNVTGGNLITAGLITATGNVTGNNVTALNQLGAATLSLSGNVTSALNVTGNIAGGNISTAGLVTATGNINSGANIVATANVIGGNISTAGLVTATGNINSGANIVATANVIGGNLITAGVATVTGNINSDANIVATANVIGGNISTAGLVTATGNVTGGNLITAGVATVTGNINSGANIVATANVIGGNISTAGLVTATGNVTGGNINTAGLASVTGNVIGGNISTAGLVNATGNITGGNIIGNTSGKFGNIVISGDDITDTNGRVNINTAGADVDFAVNGDTVANVFYVDAGTGTASFGTATQTTNALVSFNTPTSVLMPVGNTLQRPSVGVTGMLRFNTTDNNFEVYDNSAWTAVGVPEFTVIADSQFNGDGSTVAFTILADQTTNSCIVSINGVVQIPVTAYSVSGTTLTFTEAPLAGDVIDVRQITSTTTVTALSNSSGNAEVSVSDTDSIVNIRGNLVPIASNTYSLGNATHSWDSLYVAGNTIYLGTLQLKQASADTFAVYTADGITAANIDVGSIDVQSITQGTSAIGIAGNNGNAYITVGGTANVVVTATTGQFVTGIQSVTGNITGGNISTAGLITAVGNVTGGNIRTGGLISATGNITGANLSITADAVITGNLTVNGTTTTINSNTITTNDKAITLGNNQSTGSALDGSGIDVGSNSLATWKFNNATTSWQSNIGITPSANATLSLGGTSNYWGTLYANAVIVATTAGVTGNITGGNILTAGLISATGTITGTGNITGGNINTAGLASITGNVIGGNISTAGLISATGSITGAAITGSSLTVGTGNVTAGNIVNGNANGVGNIGSSTTYYNTVFAKATSAQYADLAEKYVADAEYAPGTVVIFGGSAEVTVNATDADRRVAGVVSTNPSYIMNGGLEADYVATVALTGRVPCFVIGPVKKGDMIVAAGLGRARAEQDPRVGTVIGKALEDFDGIEGTIEVVVGRF